MSSPATSNLDAVLLHCDDLTACSMDITDPLSFVDGEAHWSSKCCFISGQAVPVTRTPFHHACFQVQVGARSPGCHKTKRLDNQNGQTIQHHDIHHQVSAILLQDCGATRHPWRNNAPSRSVRNDDWNTVFPSWRGTHHFPSKPQC